MPITSEHETDFLCAFAKAFLAWQYVENMLFLVFNELVRHDRPEIVSAAFYAVHGLRARLDMTNEVFQVVIVDETLRKKWATLREHVGTRQLLRDKFAHLTVSAVTVGDTSSLKLTPTVYKISSRPTVAHDIKEIDSFGALFRQLAEELYEFHEEIGIHLGPTKSPSPHLY